jgi:putative flippase GtrA
MRYVFSHRENMSSSHEFVLFLMLSVVGLAINEVIIWIGTKTLGTSGLMVTITKVVATTVVMVWNFISRKRWLDGGSK